MDMIKVSEYAQALYSAHGDKAELEAARRQSQYEAAGDKMEADTWRSIRESIRQMKGPNQS
jgi:hypothetical protein